MAERKRETSGYLAGGCPNCGRVRLESITDTATEEVVGIRCEKCRMQWPLDVSGGEYWAWDDERNPLHTLTVYPDDGPFGEPDRSALPEPDDGASGPENSHGSVSDKAVSGESGEVDRG